MIRVEGLEDVGDLVYTLGRVLEAVKPGRLLGRHVKRVGRRLIVEGKVIELDEFDDFVVLAVGKASYSMAAKMLKLLEGRPVWGLPCCPAATNRPEASSPSKRSTHRTPNPTRQA
jgi:glycerate-2-kinase